MSKNKKILLRILVAAVLYVSTLIITNMLLMPAYTAFVLFFVVYLLIGYDIVLAAIGGIGRGQIFDENFLMVLATAAAFITGEYPEAVAVMLLFQIGELFQRYAVGRSRGSISDLMELRPDVARVIVDELETEVIPEEVNVGQIIRVKPGERIPLDGVVISGHGTLNMTALTGEPVPRNCSCGDSVLSGSISLTGVLDIRVEKSYYDSTVSKILDMVENVSGKKARAERFITRFARYYTPVVVGLAILQTVIPPILGGEWTESIHNAMNFLVVSCPCALVISVPLSFYCGIGAASRHGILVKGGSYLEQLNKVQSFVFDKTGTLTYGTFRVTEVMPEDNRDEILHLAAIAESGSLHPIARSILQEVDPVPHEGWEITEYFGLGVQATKGQDRIIVGNEKWMMDQNIELTDNNIIGTLVHVALNGIYKGSILISDVIREDAAMVISCLKEEGYHTVMLTGDRFDTAITVSEKIGTDGFVSDLLPDHKVLEIERLMSGAKKGSLVAFVGDGINDAPVLMRADVGIAMGGIGSDAAIEAADIVLMYDRLSSLPIAKRIAEKTMLIVHQNIIFALGVKFAVLALTPFGMVSVWLAVFADVGVAMIAILNAMRAGRTGKSIQGVLE